MVTPGVMPLMLARERRASSRELIANLEFPDSANLMKLHTGSHMSWFDYTDQRTIPWPGDTT